MATKIDICNMALSLVSEDQISDITALDSSNDLNARLCRLHFDHSKKMALRLYPWRRATKRAVLSQNTVGPAFGEYTYSYNLPSDYITIQSLNELDISADPHIFYEIEGWTLLTNETTASIVYTANVDVGILDELCADLITYILASRIAFGMRGDEARGRELLSLGMQMILPQARSANNMERHRELPSRVQGSKRWRSRRSGPNG